MNRPEILDAAKACVTADRDPRAKWQNPAGTKTYYAWRNMRARCMNPNEASFANYGGRGIRVCDRWAESYDAFVADMGEAPEGLTLDRIDVNGNYEPGNCRWAGWDVQHNNKRTNRPLTFHGVTKNLTEWAKDLGLSTDTLHHRLARLPVEEALQPGSIAPTWKHGTRHGYETGCRCDECRAAHAARHRSMRARRAAKKEQADG